MDSLIYYPPVDDVLPDPSAPYSIDEGKGCSEHTVLDSPGTFNGSWRLYPITVRVY